MYNNSDADDSSVDVTVSSENVLSALEGVVVSDQHKVDIIKQHPQLCVMVIHTAKKYLQLVLNQPQVDEREYDNQQ